MKVTLCMFLLGIVLKYTTRTEVQAHETCINSKSFRLRHKACMECSCSQLKKMSVDFITKMCRMNRWDMNPELPGTHRACCHLCKDYADSIAENCYLYLECPSREKKQGFCGYADLTIVGLVSNNPKETLVTHPSMVVNERYLRVQTSAEYPAFAITFDDTMYATGDMCLKYKVGAFPEGSVPQLHINIYVGDEESFQHSQDLNTEDMEQTHQFNIKAKTQNDPIKMIVSYETSYYIYRPYIETAFKLIDITGCLCEE